MAVTITNLTARPIYVPLNSGENLRLSPRATSGAVDDVEVKGNATVQKLLSQRMITVEPAGKGTEAADEGDARHRARKRG